MLRELRVAYHAFMEGYHSHKFLAVLASSKVTDDVILTANGLEGVCHALASHTEALVKLIPSGSEAHTATSAKLASLKEADETIRRYKKSRIKADEVHPKLYIFKS